MSPAPTQTPPLTLAGKYLVVTLGDETIGLPVSLVREIIRAQKVTPLPERSTKLEGVINLRGRIIPIADLRMRFGQPSAFGETTCFVIVNLPSARGGTAPLGLIVDSVEEVTQLPMSAIEPAPESMGLAGSSCLLGIAKADGRVMPLVDVGRLFEVE